MQEKTFIKTSLTLSLIKQLREVGKSWNSFASHSLKFLVSIYRVFFSGYLGGNCRFTPSCSVYAEQCFESHSPIKALQLTLARLLRCHPFSKSAYDPVPEKCVGKHNHRGCDFE